MKISHCIYKLLYFVLMSFLLGTRGCFIWSYPRNPFIIIMALVFETADEWGRWVAYTETLISF